MANASDGDTIQTWHVGEWIGTYKENDDASILFEPAVFEGPHNLKTSGKFYMGSINDDIRDRYSGEGGTYTLHDLREEEGMLRITLKGGVGSVILGEGGGVGTEVILLEGGGVGMAILGVDSGADPA